VKVSRAFLHQTLKQPKLAQLNGVVYKWFTAIYLEENPVIGRMIIEQA